MIPDLPIHHRRSIRLKGYDYTRPGAYFVTNCAYQRAEIFGEIVAGIMRLNPSGEIIREEWIKTGRIRPSVVLHEDEFVIMPNHIHGIIWIVENATVGGTRGSIESMTVGATHRVARTINGRVAPTDDARDVHADNARGASTKSTTIVSGSLGAILGQFKSISAKRINALRSSPGAGVWQRNYYEHIIRNENEFKNIWNYIDTNPLRWQEDQLNPFASPNPINQDNP
jgi:putative transposase